MTPRPPRHRTGRIALLGSLGLGLGFSLACTAQYKTIDEQVICDEVGFAISARVHACTGDEALALAHHDAFTSGYSCKQGWFDDWEKTEDAYSCATTMGEVSCADAAELGTDIGAWLALDEDCDDILKEGPASAGSGTGGEGSGGEGTGGEGTGGEGTGGEGTGGEGTGGGTGGTGTGGEGTGGGTGGDPDPTISGTLYQAGSNTPLSGTSICLWDTARTNWTDCTTAGTDGTYTFDPAPQGELRPVYISGGNTLAHFVDLDLGDGPYEGVDLWVLTATALNAAGSSIGQTPMSGRSQVPFQVVDETGLPLEGVVVALDPAPAEGQVTHLDPSTGTFASEHTETTTYGSGIWMNITPGDYAVTATHASRTCEPVVPIATDGAGGALVRANAGYVFAANFVCTP